MAKHTTIRLVEHFAELEDPRLDRTKEHLLIDIVTIAICAVICGADDWVEVAAFGRAKEKWLRQFLKLPHGIPSHDILRLRSGQALLAGVPGSRPAAI